MLRWMRRHLGGKGRGAVGAMLNGADEMWHATAVRGREELDRQHRHVVPAPSPGEKMFEEGRVVLSRPARPAGGDPGAPTAQPAGSAVPCSAIPDDATPDDATPDDAPRER